MATKTDQIVKAENFSVEELRNVGTFEDVLNLATARDIPTVDSATVIGDGFTLLDNKEKARLIGVPMLVLGWRFAQGDHGEFVSAHVMTKNNEKFILNDGSTGIYQQLRELTDSGNTGVLACRNGLRRSDYEYPDPTTGEMKPAVTFYIA